VGAEPPLVAPGQHVYAVDEALPGATDTACGPEGAPDATLRAPAATTGSSTAAILVSALAARLQSERLARGETPLAPHALRGLLQALGAGANRAASNGEPVRQARLCDSTAALDCLAAGAQTCLERLLPAGDAAGADACLAGCVLGCATPDPEPVPWGDEYAPETPDACVCHDTASPPEVELATCAGEAEGCPHERTVDQHSAGPLGPQPTIPDCPDCAYRLLPGSAQAILDLNPQLPTTVAFHNAWIVLVKTAAGATTTSTIPLAGRTAFTTWHPGVRVTLTGLPNPGAGVQLKATLHAISSTPGGAPTTKLSALRVVSY
jgi:hypothetical protein